MKKFISILFVFANFVCSAQNVIDTAYLQCTYEYKYVDDTIKMTTTTDNAMVLLVGKKASAFYSYKTFVCDSAVQNMAEAEKLNVLNNISEFLEKYPRGETFKVYKNYSEDNILYMDDVGTHDKFMYSEPLKLQNWTLTNETKELHGYKCNKATCNYCGRNYEAWYTTNIQISDGPWKFNGLPGLIVLVYDEDLHYKYELYAVNKINKPIEIDTQKYRTISKKEYIHLLRMKIKYPLTSLGLKYTSMPKEEGLKYDVMERSE